MDLHLPPTRRQTLAGLAASLITLPARAQAPAPPPDGFRVLEARKGTLRLLPEPSKATPVFAYDGLVPGPVLRVKQGEMVKIRLLNRLDQPTALHFQGVRLPNAMDGVPGLTQAPIPPGGSFDYAFAAPDAGTYLYRPSHLANHAQQMARGLFGLLIVDEAEPPVCDLELLATLDDWQVDEKGGITGAFNTLPDGGHRGALTRLVTLNARAVPDRHVLKPGSRVRLRLANATVGRLTAISFDGMRPLITAIDGQNCDPFEPVRRTLPSSPGSRFDLMFDLPASGEARVILRGENEPDCDLVVFKSEGEARDALPPITRQPLNPRLPAVIRLQDAKKLEVVIEANLHGDSNHLWKINGTSTYGLPAKPLFSVKAGTPVLMGLANKSTKAHAMHFHGHNIRLLHDLDDGWEPYWRDQLVIEAGKTHHIAFIADNPGKWLVECMMLEHGGTGLAAWFEVA